MNEQQNEVTVKVSYQLPNFIGCVWNAILALNCSPYAVLRSVNSELGRMKQKGAEQVTNGSVKTSKKSGTSASLNVSVKLNINEVTLPYQFAEWNDKLSKVNKLATIPSIELPEVFATWISTTKGFQAEKPAEQAAQ